jgi:hypothetical protein
MSPLFALSKTMDWIVFCLAILPFLLILTPWWNALNYAFRRWKIGEGTVQKKETTWRDREDLVLDGDVVELDAKMFYSFELKSIEGWEDKVWVKEDIYKSLHEGMSIRFQCRTGRFHSRREIIPIV